MRRDQIDRLLSEGKFPKVTELRQLVETHISWVILCDRFVYKIKRPIKYSFLDFSTLELRKHFCERELELNQRMSTDMYQEVLPIYESNEVYTIGGDGDALVDYALKMRKLDSQRQMDVLVAKNKVSTADIKNLAQRIAIFHKTTNIIFKKNVLDVKEKFNALSEEKEFLTEHLNENIGNRIDIAIQISNAFLDQNKALLDERLKNGFFRDCHGDLHTRNIFLLPEPQPFDCIEFNDDYRQIDVLNEVAFLCMDLDAWGRKDLSDMFIEQYNKVFPTIRNEAEYQLFVYFKSYRANVRAKVNSLRAKSASDKASKMRALAELEKYLKLMESYVELLRRTALTHLNR
ncbi:hypothetical protein [Maribacter aestuarii]|uniref:hypothetical protein n=1 Tax=Maribacter aestuarii TaxID=1130723 RepID=UPI0025A58D9B|nr:hypothetical protein [Maribacter aestuarii]